MATPSDPHSAEAEEREAWAAFVAGHASRDAEVAELKAKIAELEHQLKVQAFEHLRNAEPVDTCGICGNPKRTGQNNFGTHQCPPY